MCKEKVEEDIFFTSKFEKMPQGASRQWGGGDGNLCASVAASNFPVGGGGLQSYVSWTKNK
jgi:hypothetical protein